MEGNGASGGQPVSGPGDVPKPYARRRYYTPDDVARHCSGHDCWVTLFGKVFDLTHLLAQYKGPLASPITEAAGGDVTHWFDPETKEARRYVDPQSCLEGVYCPQGRFIHVGPIYPDSAWATDFGTPWWRDERYQIGDLTRKTRTVRLLNLLTRQTTDLVVCSEETLEEIQERYLPYNFQAASYTWKRLAVPLDMSKTLDENGMPDDSEELQSIGLDPDDHVPVIHLYFNDDLTEG
ncbi:unnamed protein product [Vitrella brassicaformis CCMP3155]|uniref:Cytochrome b5 domain-containing protein 1 n=1 Tax=Vitrella brassicaformis (strain CCMP3155) TaxID=1169540 RepID=A0A0G4GP07_VITBC|nr:unnamed protein product [Vitrella brassicaformis CCMP3155]|mmetsp:Transcript_41355/g.103217  ORF Transcript_41355/g.103217 Transcript_41355/m.103217 type:complete len:236 (-) Transcript_41355:299-1006(-)|eukprot:CEM31905.1 unnamed protein product [Vitrella brassicaformis CCMP3155]